MLFYLFIMDASVWLIVYSGLRICNRSHRDAMLGSACIMAAAAICVIFYIAWRMLA